VNVGPDCFRIPDPPGSSRGHFHDPLVGFKPQAVCDFFEFLSGFFLEPGGYKAALAGNYFGPLPGGDCWRRVSNGW